MTAGIDTPDRRGRTGLDRVGRDLTGNPRVKVREVTLLSSHWYVERTTTFDFRHADGTWSTQERETHDRGNGATLLLYDAERETVLLTRQFRYPVYTNGHPDGMLVETPGACSTRTTSIPKSPYGARSSRRPDTPSATCSTSSTST